MHSLTTGLWLNFTVSRLNSSLSSKLGVLQCKIMEYAILGSRYYYFSAITPYRLSCTLPWVPVHQLFYLSNQEYVSTTQAKNYSIISTQWHPEVCFLSCKSLVSNITLTCVTLLLPLIPSWHSIQKATFEWGQGFPDSQMVNYLTTNGYRLF